MSRLLGLLLLGLLVVLLASSCETTRTRENADPMKQAETMTEAHAAATATRQVMQVNATGGIDYKTPQSVMAAALIRQFHDGTVIDRVIARKAPLDDPKARPAYYLVGLGTNNGSFRAIAMPLRGSDDGTFYLAPSADRYVITSVGCPSCYFDFEDGFIVGTTCDDSSGGSTCTLKVLTGNEVFVKKEPAK
ncbi:MAG: hypothetical protein ACRYFX_00275 [Janthinobacterium lividum]